VAVRMAVLFDILGSGPVALPIPKEHA